MPPDPGYAGFEGRARENENKSYDLHDIRKYTLWGNLMAGGAGVEYYFGYQLPQNDLACEDWRSRDRSWDYCRIALEFFKDHDVPFQEMTNTNDLIDNARNDNRRYCLAKTGELYLVYLPEGGATELDLNGVRGDFDVKWFNPRAGGDLQRGSVTRVNGRQRAGLGNPPAEPDEDWLVMVGRP